MRRKLWLTALVVAGLAAAPMIGVAAPNPTTPASAAAPSTAEAHEPTSHTPAPSDAPRSTTQLSRTQPSQPTHHASLPTGAEPTGAADDATSARGVAAVVRTPTVSSGGALLNPSPGMGLAATIQVPPGDPGVAEQRVEQTSELPADGGGVGSSRVVCRYSHLGFDDPIVKPNQPGASHLHTFFGNTGTNAASTPESIANSGNSTCVGGTANRSAYWVPTLYDDRTGQPVVPEFSIFYYKTGYRGIQNADVRPIPAGLRMVSGDPAATEPQEDVSWGCWDRFVGNLPSIPPTECSVSEDVSMGMSFPQCWNGRDLDSPDHRSHMSAPVDGACPASHPVALPEISVHLRYDVQDRSDPQHWRLSSDMYDKAKPGGLSLHADWFNGWDPLVSKSFVENCVGKGLDCHAGLLGDGRTLF